MDADWDLHAVIQGFTTVNSKSSFSSAAATSNNATIIGGRGILDPQPQVPLPPPPPPPPLNVKVPPPFPAEPGFIGYFGNGEGRRDWNFNLINGPFRANNQDLQQLSQPSRPSLLPLQAPHINNNLSTPTTVPPYPAGVTGQQQSQQFQMRHPSPTQYLFRRLQRQQQQQKIQQQLQVQQQVEQQRQVQQQQIQKQRQVQQQIQQQSQVQQQQIQKQWQVQQQQIQKQWQVQQQQQQQKMQRGSQVQQQQQQQKIQRGSQVQQQQQQVQQQTQLQYRQQIQERSQVQQQQIQQQSQVQQQQNQPQQLFQQLHSQQLHFHQQSQQPKQSDVSFVPNRFVMGTNNTNAGGGDGTVHRQRLKRRKKKASASPSQRQGNERRRNLAQRVFHVTAEGLSSDVWGWRKYGEKPLRGSLYPRNYYRCSTKTDCQARKYTERSGDDPTKFIFTYRGEHDHPAPARLNVQAGSTRTKSTSNPHVPPKACNRAIITASTRPQPPPQLAPSRAKNSVALLRVGNQ